MRIKKNHLKLILNAVTEAHRALEKKGDTGKAFRDLRWLEDELGSLQGDNFELKEMGSPAEFPREVKA